MKTTQLIAGESLMSGLLVAVRADGKVHYVLDPSDPNAAARPMCQQHVVAKNETQTPNILGVKPEAGENQKAMASITLPNGNYAVGFTATGKYHLTMYSATGAMLFKTTFGVTSEQAEIALVALRDGKIAVAMKLGTTGCVQVVVVDADGVAKTANVIEQTDTASSLSVVLLNNGDFAVAFATDNVRHEVRAAVFNTKCEAVAPVRTIDFFDQPTTTRQSVVAAAISTGFMVAYSGVEAPSGKVYFKLLDYTGLANSSGRTQVGDAIHLAEDAPFVTAVALKDGFAIGSYGGIGPGFQLNIYNGEGEGLGGNITLDPFDAMMKPNRMALACLDNGNVGVIWATRSNAQGAVYSPAGRTVFKRAHYGSGVGSVAIAAAPGGAVVAMQGQDTSDSSLQMYAGYVNYNLYGDVAMTTVQASNRFSAIVVGPVPSTLPYEGSTMLFTGGNVDDQLVQVDLMASYELPAQVVIGVTVGDAEKDEPIEVVVEGDATLATPFKRPGAYNYRDSSMPGQKFSVIGNLVSLKGIQ